jgi:hypothetical protein
LTKAVGSSGTIKFRGKPFQIRGFSSVVPDILFPIDSEQKLVTLLYEAVRLAPTSISYSEDDPVYAKRKLRRLGIIGLRQGMLGRGGGFSPKGRMSTINESQ